MYNSNIFNTLKSTPATKQQHWITAQSTTQHDYQHHHQDLGFSVIIFVLFFKKGRKKKEENHQSLIYVWNQPKQSSKIFLEFKGLSPNEIGEGSDLTVRGIPSRRAPERQRWTFPSHTIISAHTIPANQVLCKSNMFSLEIMHPLAF